MSLCETITSQSCLTIYHFVRAKIKSIVYHPMQEFASIDFVKFLISDLDRPQHLSGLKLVSDLCHGELLGGAVKSSEITFIPSTIQSGRFIADTKTAG